MRRKLRARIRTLVLAAALTGFAANGAVGAEYDLPPDHDVIGEVRRIEARYEDTFVALAREHGVGYEELRLANPDVDPWLPGEGTEIVLPTQYVLPVAPREGIVINVPELRLYYFPPDRPDKVVTHPISIGRMDWQTPLGVTTVVAKADNPSWYPPQSIREEHAARNDPLPAVVPPGPDNPLGKHALRLGIPGYLIHGTNKPSGVGMRVTHGCIRMFPEDIEALFGAVPTGTRVNIVNQPYKLGWSDNGGLFLEVHPPLAEEVERGEWTATQLTRAFVAATSERRAQFSWDAAEKIVRDARGVPVAVAIGPAIEVIEVLDTDVLEADVVETEAIDAEVTEADPGESTVL
ncbi:MAG: L,D-transpeptidase family protein [Gammaproteobacteria bacterium]|nr:L,D-transpeptidase family protein [Gammaproteobacteria bacterium]